MTWFFLLSGLFLGWSLGANDAANVFGTAVGTRMVKFKIAALVAGVFVVLGAVISGAGAAHTLGKLGAVNAIAGSFTVALASAATVAWMTRLNMPVSTSQAIVGGIIGWNLFTGSPTDFSSLTKIVSTWVICPLLAAGFAFLMFNVVKYFLDKSKIHLLERDLFTRAGLILVGAFGAYSLGANNIANVMGVFVPASPFNDIHFNGAVIFTGTQQLFLLGGLAITVGIYTYSQRVMRTVGNELFKLTPIMALIVVLSESLVLFLFASQRLQEFLIAHGLPPIPLVPVSSSQAVIGAVVGIALAKGGRGIRYSVLGKIASGWITTPLLAALLSLVSLFIVQNVFEQKVVSTVTYNISSDVMNQLERQGLPTGQLARLKGKSIRGASRFRHALEATYHWKEEQLGIIFNYAETDSFYINPFKLKMAIMRENFSPAELQAVDSLQGRSFRYKWQFNQALEAAGDAWKPRTGPSSEIFNRNLQAKRDAIFSIFKVKRTK